MTAPNVKVVEHHRLSSEMFAKVKAGLPAPIITNDTSAHMAGYLLGIQHVLAILQRDIVVA